MPLKPSWHSQVNWPPAWLLQRPWGPQTFEEIYRSPSGVLLDATATVQLSITVKVSMKEQNPAVKSLGSLQTDIKWHKIYQSFWHYPFFHLTAIQAIYLDIFWFTLQSKSRFYICFCRKSVWGGLLMHISPDSAQKETWWAYLAVGFASPQTHTHFKTSKAENPTES